MSDSGDHVWWPEDLPVPGAGPTPEDEVTTHPTPPPPEPEETPPAPPPAPPPPPRLAPDPEVAARRRGALAMGIVILLGAVGFVFLASNVDGPLVDDPPVDTTTDDAPGPTAEPIEPADADLAASLPPLETTEAGLTWDRRDGPGWREDRLVESDGDVVATIHVGVVSAVVRDGSPEPAGDTAAVLSSLLREHAGADVDTGLDDVAPSAFGSVTVLPDDGPATVLLLGPDDVPVVFRDLGLVVVYDLDGTAFVVAAALPTFDGDVESSTAAFLGLGERLTQVAEATAR